MSGTLYVIGTPIGNMEDITLRQLRIMKNVDFICTEDTRVTLKLLNRYEIKKELVSFHKYSSRSDIKCIIDRLIAEQSCGVVTDAGMPCISDPGDIIVKLCVENSIDVKVVPGPTAMTSAIVLSGLHINRFTFEGFLPISKKERFKRLELLYDETAVIIFYESPHKLKATLADFLRFFGTDRQIIICRELTKFHEEVLRMTLGEAVSYYEVNKPKGEFVLILNRKNYMPTLESLEQAIEQVRMLINQGKKSTEACKEVAKKTRFHKSELYTALQCLYEIEKKCSG